MLGRFNTGMDVLTSRIAQYLTNTEVNELKGLTLEEVEMYLAVRGNIEEIITNGLVYGVIILIAIVVIYAIIHKFKIVKK